MSNRMYTLGLGLFASLLTVIALFVYARYRLRSGENFERRFPPHILGIKQHLELPYNSFYLAGTDSSGIYLGNHRKAELVININNLTLDTFTIPFSLPDSLRKKSGWQWKFQAGGAFCYNFLYSDLYWWKNARFSIPPDHFKFSPINNLQAISPLQVVVNTFESGTQRRKVQAIRLDSPAVISQYYPTQANDGIYSSHGHLLYDQLTHQVLYVHSYWNRIQMLDTALNVKGESHTIDLKNQFDLVITEYGAPQAPQLKAGGNVLNKHATIGKGYLLVLSSQAARNQKLKQLQKLWTIDVYEITSGDYLYSFYLPRKKETNNLDFLLLGEQLFTLEGSTITRYELNLPHRR